MKYIFYLALGALILTSCESIDPVIPNEEELITTLKLTMISEDGSDTAIFSFQDLDGDGGNAPVVSSKRLLANTTYSSTVYLANESENPAEDITEEVAEENVEHQFFYSFDKDIATVIYDDKDANGNDLGIKTKISTKSVSTGQLTVTLRHNPTKPNQGDLTTAGGETDIEVTFDVDIQ